MTVSSTPAGLTAGEQWARAELERLRAARFAPRSICAFLSESQRRAGEVRAARPELAHRARWWTAAGAVAWVGFAASRPAGRGRLATRGLIWWTAVAIMLDWHLGMFETGDGLPRNLGLADALTLARAWLVPAIADDLSPSIVLAAAATDVLDGIAARATTPTRAGRDLEGLVDSVVFGAALLGARRRDELPRATVVLEGTRLAAGVAYGVLTYFRQADAPDPVIMRAARATTPLRVGALLAAGQGRRRVASALLATGSVLSLAALAAAVREQSR